MGVSLSGGLNSSGKPDCNFTDAQYDALEEFIDRNIEKAKVITTFTIVRESELNG